jgi:hypothetical protein
MGGLEYDLVENIILHWLCVYVCTLLSFILSYISIEFAYELVLYYIYYALESREGC